MVPKIRNVDKKNINELSLELKIVVIKCRKLKIDKKKFLWGINDYNKPWRYRWVHFLLL